MPRYDACGFRVDELLSFIIDRFFFFTHMSDYSDFTMVANFLRCIKENSVHICRV